MTLRFDKTSSDSLKFNQVIVDHLLDKVLGHAEALASDDSRVSDFRSFMEDHGKKINDTQWEFVRFQTDMAAVRRDYETNSIIGVPKDKRDQYKIRKVIIVDDSDVSKNQDLLDKIKDVFEISLEPSSLNKKISELALEISSKISPKKRKELETK